MAPLILGLEFPALTTLEARGTEVQVVLFMMGQEELGILARVVTRMMVLVGHVIRVLVAHVIQITEVQAFSVPVFVDRRCTQYKHLTNKTVVLH